MRTDAPTTTPPTSPSDPPDRTGTAVPTRIAFVLHAVGILLGYGRHMLDTVHHRAAAPNFSSIAACFGTANLATILAHLYRGFLRALALKRVLLARAATGRDINIDTPRVRTAKPPPAPADTQVEPPAARTTAPRKSLPPGWEDAAFFMPTLEELERQVRRQPIGRTITEICRDLGVMPRLCTIPFWDEIYEIMRCLRGNLASLMEENIRRERAFDQEQDRKRGSDWSWMHLKRDAIRQALGFLIGETPVDPFAAAATGPP